LRDLVSIMALKAMAAAACVHLSRWGAKSALASSIRLDSFASVFGSSTVDSHVNAQYMILIVGPIEPGRGLERKQRHNLDKKPEAFIDDRMRRATTVREM